MDSNPHLLRRTHSPSVAAAVAATPTTTVVETHTHQQQHHNHNHNHGHNHSHSNSSAGQGLRPTGMGALSLHIGSGIHGGNSLVQIKKPLTATHGAGVSISSSSSVASSLSPVQIHSHGHGVGLSGQSLHHESQIQHLHHNHDHDHKHDHDHSHDHHHDHSHDHDARIGNFNGFHGGAPDHKHEPHQHQHQHQYFESQHFQHQQNHHDHFGHDHQGHDHAHDHGHGHGHGHGHDHGHDHAHPHHHDHTHSLDNHEHNHGHNHGHSQGHNHGHDHHGHDHHGHDHPGHVHGHDHHGHDHGHHHQQHYPVSFRPQLPSYGQIFGDLMPKQKTMFTWVLLHSTIACMTWLSGMRAGSLSLIGLAYMMLFDAFGVLNIFISSVIHTDMRMKRATVKHPFGVQRFEILFGLFNAIFLLFIGMNMLKESLEHWMLEDDHHGDNEHGTYYGVVHVPLFWTLIGLGATLTSALGYQNHGQFCQLLETRSLTSSQTAFGRADTSKLTALARNRFTLTSLGCIVGVVLVALFPQVDGLDKLVAIGQSMVMFLLGGPLTKTLGMILLQTTPAGALEGVEEAIRQLSAASPAIVRIERAHVWTNTYGQLIGTLIVSVAKGSDEQAILAIIHQRLQGFLDLDAKTEGTGELTVQLAQH